ncbi:pyruvate dehydrogenase E1 component alpha [Blastocystis sp. subtype 4]|uniref:pyruvate dehydrogenase E1 component alpha n=1 Tax=Blastocystis sp. subtype 4 TaxID=944170 RepID=UPI000711BE6E|nr:pyruvate dehydrogenase E1 component alpha [Blastocystis sp. subtype 4]KNB42024.1 pyruvate dehydrogenase E1 component alpha [Blastocystis sp. subtype 4]|eukprot:XP_014525467.1 pyruvate dehydrogenase E1 component alpha [Blastocystis sp. subtype 4]
MSRQTRDSVNYIGHVLVQNGIMDEKQWKDFQNDIKKQVKGWVTDCLKESPPAESELLTDILYGETPDFIRGIEYVNSKTTKPLLY